MNYDTATEVMVYLTGVLPNHALQWTRERLQPHGGVFRKVGDRYVVGDAEGALAVLQTRQTDVLLAIYLAVANPHRSIAVGHLYAGTERRDRRIRARVVNQIAAIAKTAPALAKQLSGGLVVDGEELRYLGGNIRT